MTIQEIFNAFDKIGCCTFATLDDGYPETRIAHFITHDEDGIYFMTMNTKPFYKQLIQTNKLLVCGLCASPNVAHLDDGNIAFDDGYFVRITGDVKEVTIDELKAKNNPIFKFCIDDNQRYPAMTAFVLYRAKGEIYDYDFEKVNRSHKINRARFSYGGFPVIKAGLTITDKCTSCGKCEKTCSFDAIYKTAEKYEIDGSRCDECGNCFVTCPSNAIIHKGK